MNACGLNPLGKLARKVFLGAAVWGWATLAAILGADDIRAEPEASLWIEQFGYEAQAWRVESHPRLLGDVDGDGRQDVVGFGNGGVYVALSKGDSFGAQRLWLDSLGHQHGWRVEKHPRFLADVDGDGREDVVGFGDEGVYVARSTGSSFSEAELWIRQFGYSSQAWRVEKHPRYLADVNGDGKSDVVGFGNGGVYVSLSTGVSFGQQRLWLDFFGYNSNGWRIEKHPRFLSDMNGDGRADAVGFGEQGVYVALSTGSSFSEAELWIRQFGYSSQAWRVEKHPRSLADVDGDGKSDVVGFGNGGVYVALSTGISFGPQRLWLSFFGEQANAWRVEKHPRLIADLNGDGKADLIGFGEEGVYRSYSTGSSFSPPELWLRQYGYSAEAWRVDKHPRAVADVTGDGVADVVGFGNAGVYVTPGRTDDSRWLIPTVRDGGVNSGRFGSLDTSMIDYLTDECMHAAAVVVQLDGRLIYKAGYGRLSYPPVDAADPDWQRCPAAGDGALSEPVQPNTPMLIGSNFKAVTAAVMRSAARRRWLEANGSEPSDTQIESMRLCPDTFDLLPPELEGFLCSGEPVPVSTAACNLQTGTADPRWNRVTLGHLLSHRAGLSGDGPNGHIPGIGNATVALPAIRNLRDRSDFVAEESKLAAFPDFQTAKERLQRLYAADGDSSREGFFLAPPTHLERLMLGLGRCLLFNPGTDFIYSNAGFILLEAMIEHVYGKPFSRHETDPTVPEDSALAEWMIEEWGTAKGELSPVAFYEPSFIYEYRNPNEPVWLDGGGDPNDLDSSWHRPDCLWSDGSRRCDFQSWWGGAFGLDHYPHRHSYFFDPDEKELRGYAWLQPGAGQGVVAVEGDAWHRFMGEFFVGTDARGFYGTRRIDGVSSGHTGSNLQAHSFQGQTYWNPAYESGADGEPLSCRSSNECREGTCQFDAGRGDRVCSTSRGMYRAPLEESDGTFPSDWPSALSVYNCELPRSLSYQARVAAGGIPGRLRAYLLHGLCGVDWDEISLVAQ